MIYVSHFTTLHYVNIQQIDNHQILNIPIVTAGVVTRTQWGEVVVIVHLYTYTEPGNTIYTWTQMEMYHNDANNKSLKVYGGK